MPTRHALLGLLARGDRYGYQLKRELEEEFGPDWRVDVGQLYRLLASLKRESWAGVRVEPGRQGPDRKVYRLTNRGRGELVRWLAEPGARVLRGRDEFPVKLRLRMAAGDPSTKALVAARRHALEEQRREQSALVENAREDRDPGRWAVADARLRQTDGSLASLASCEALLPTRRPRRTRAAPTSEPLLAIGSDDALVDLLGHFLSGEHPDLRFRASSVGSLGGLIALSERRAHLAGIHLLDVESGEYNVPFVKHLMLEEPVVLVNLAYREQGLMVAPGNPRSIRRLRDLLRPGIRLVNRQRGAGTRLLLYHRLRAARIDPRSIAGYERGAPTHGAVAAAIAAGTADVGPGIRAAAVAWGLDFIPLGHERYDFVIPRGTFDSPRLRPLLEVLNENAFRRTAAAFIGYDVSRMGEIVADIRG